ncbi:MAG: primosomal protein N', partial [Clostridia bacterium]|nr:primosomal protein N' [Clostridia bacterium]
MFDKIKAMIAEVIVDVAVSQVDKVFEYAVPPDFDLQIGMRVLVPFGNRTLDGFVLNLKETSKFPLENLKAILKIKSPKPEISKEMLALCEFMVEKYNIKKVEALRLFISAEVRSGKVKPKSLIYLALNPNLPLENYKKTLKRITEKQAKLLEFLEKNPLNLQSELRTEFGASVVDKFKKEGLLLTKEINVDRRPDAMKIEKKKVILNPEQQKAVDAISTFEPKTYVLFGVTGSGKTEVYLTLIEKALEKGKSAILLVPEISLTPQMLGNLKNRFGETVAVLHSGLSQGEKFDEWNRILSGEAKVVVGARSAIFAPLENVGIIVIDEEHESSYNSETSPRYKTIEVAEFRKNFNSCPLVLGSATPSIETFAKTELDEYTLLELPHRASNYDMPKVQIVDMLGEIRAGNGGMFSRALLSELDDCFRAKKQAILFGTLVLVITIAIIITFFFLIKPQNAEKADLDSQKNSENVQNIENVQNNIEETQ